MSDRDRLEHLAAELRRTHDIALGKKAELELAHAAFDAARDTLSAAYSDENIARSALLSHIHGPDERWT